MSVNCGSRTRGRNVTVSVLYLLSYQEDSGNFLFFVLLSLTARSPIFSEVNFIIRVRVRRSSSFTEVRVRIRVRFRARVTRELGFGTGLSNGPMV